MYYARHILAVGVLSITTAFSTRAVAANEVRIGVVNYEQYWEYAVDPVAGSVALISTESKPSGSKWPQQLETVLRDLRARVVRRTFAVTQLSPAARSDFRWAAPSPNCQFFVAGPENAEFDTLRRATLGRDDPWKPIAQVSLGKDNFVKDLGWSSDSRFLVIVETSQRYGGIGGVIGHPTPHDKLTAIIVATDTGAVRRVEFAKDVTYATVLVKDEVQKCPAR
ncbi:MAG: hypothetical protein ACREUW_21845 [Burkholderiales bacterium]